MLATYVCIRWDGTAWVACTDADHTASFPGGADAARKAFAFQQCVEWVRLVTGNMHPFIEVI